MPTTGSMAQKAARQRPSCASTPPAKGPVTAATPHATDTVVSVRGHRLGGNNARIIEWTTAIVMPPPRPCTARPATITIMAGAAAQAMLPATNTTLARTSPARRPRRRSTAELAALPTIEATA